MPMERGFLRMLKRLLNGRGVTKNGNQAFKWFLSAANQDFPDAQFNLGVMYANGTGILKDLSKAKYWIKKSYENLEASVSTVKLAKDKWKTLELWKY